VSFTFSEETPYSVETEAWARPAVHGGAFWQMSVHTLPARLGLVIMAGSRAVFPELTVQAGEQAKLVFGAALPDISADGLDVILRFHTTDGVAVELFRKLLPKFDAAEPWLDQTVDLARLEGFSGCFSVECGTGDGDPRGDWLALYELVVTTPDRMGLERARAFREWRERNEKEHFSATALPSTPPAPEEEGGFLGSLLGRFRERSLSLSPPGAQRLAGDWLQKELKRPIPDFPARLQDRIDHLSKNNRLRVLSLCSGTADKETKLLRRVKGSDRVSLTILELNPDLVARAKSQLEPLCEVRALALDANDLDLNGERFDIILCAAGLHHLIELERVIEEISRSLVAEGEFWSIGEYVGRSGARLWPDAYAIANPFFKRLPAKYRVNHAWPDGRVDAELPNFDCSVGTFEGIRSEEIEPLLGRILLPHYVTKQACFLWRFFDGSYIANYDLTNKDDLAVIRRAVSQDAEHQRLGGKPTNLNGVYRKRM
jgi:SAM-dependent methyltransferase